MDDRAWVRVTLRPEADLRVSALSGYALEFHDTGATAVILAIGSLPELARIRVAIPLDSIVSVEVIGALPTR